MADLIDIIAPEGQQEGTQSTLTQWLKTPGDAVIMHEPLIELETDKVMVEVAAPAGGVLREVLIDQDAQVQPGDILGRIEAGVSETSDVTDEVTKSSGERRSEKTLERSSIKLSPAVRRLIKEHSLDAALIPGSGQDGRITHKDVMDFLASGGQPAAAPASASSSAPGKDAVAGDGGSKKIPHTTMRKRIADHMVHSMQTAPHVTSVFDADMSAVAAHRKDHKDAFAKDGIKLTYTAYFLSAASAALSAVPEVNSQFHDNDLEIFFDHNIGVGTALGDAGVIVPVIRGIQKLGLREIAQQLDQLTNKARSGELSPDEVRGGTFTISNHGVSGSLIATPIIINQPQCAILGVGKLENRVVVVTENGQNTIAVKPMCYVSLTIDHRVLDAHQTNKFLSVFVEALENWAS